MLISTDKAVDLVGMELNSPKRANRRRARVAGLPGRDRRPLRQCPRFRARSSLFSSARSKGDPSPSRIQTRPHFHDLKPAPLVLKTGGAGKEPDIPLGHGRAGQIRELAEQMIRFYGYVPGKDIRIEYIGLRHGERLEERLYSSEEVLVPTEYPRVNRLERRAASPMPISEVIASLEPCCVVVPGREKDYRNRASLRAALKKSVPTFIVPDNESSY